MGIWIARDKCGDLNVYCKKPERRKYYFSVSSFIGEVPRRQYPEVTWENSPIELVADINDIKNDNL